MPLPNSSRSQRLIGATPLLEIHCRYRGREQRIYAKHEAYNFTGSIKDRMALYILQRAYASGEIAPGDVIAEATSGNTGISFAAIGRALGHPVRIYMPDWMSRERVLVIQSLGAAVIPVSAELGGFLGSIRMADDFAREAGHVFRPQQFDNTANVQAHYETTGPEITAQLATLQRQPTAFVAGVGTGGTVMGVARHLRETLRRRGRASARARELTDAAHRSQGGPAPHPGHQRRVRALDRQARGPRPHHRRVGWRCHRDVAAPGQ